MLALNIPSPLPAFLIAVSFASAAIPIGGGYLKFDWLGAMLLLAFGFARLLSTLKLNPTAVRFAAVFLPYLILSGLIAAFDKGFNSRGFISYLGQYAIAIGSFIVIASMRIDTERLHRLLRLWVWIACIASLLAIAQRLSGRLLIDGLLFIPYYDAATISEKQIAGTLASTAWFSEASWFGSFLVVPTVYAFGTRRWLALGVLTTGLFLGYSLTAMLSVGAGIGILALMLRRFFTLALLAGAVFAFTSGLIAERFIELYANLVDFVPGSTAEGTATSFYVRSIGWYEGIQAFLANPVLGIGLGQGPIPYHSGAITLAAELGSIGLAIYYALPLLAMHRLHRIPGTQILIAMLIADFANGLITHHAFHLQRWLLISLVIGWMAHRSTSSARAQ